MRRRAIVILSEAKNLALLGWVLIVITFSGCLMVPTPYHPDKDYDGSANGHDIRHVIGHSDLQVGSSHRADVERVLGGPTTRSTDDRVFIYAQQMFSGFGIVFPPFYPAAGPLKQRTCFLRLTFDEHDVLQDGSITWGDSKDANMGYMIEGPDSVPRGLLLP